MRMILMIAAAILLHTSCGKKNEAGRFQRVSSLEYFDTQEGISYTLMTHSEEGDSSFMYATALDIKTGEVSVILPPSIPYSNNQKFLSEAEKRGWINKK